MFLAGEVARTKERRICVIEVVTVLLEIQQKTRNL